MKAITIAGGIGKDAETRQTQNGDSVTSFSVAVDDRQGQEKRAIWFDCAIWGKRGTTLAQYLTKGSKVAVSGELSTREHNGKTYLTVRAEQVTLLGGGQRDDSPRHQDPARQAPSSGRPMDDIDSIPFAPEWRI